MRRKTLLAIGAGLMLLAPTTAAIASHNSFSYQGTLKDNGLAVSATADLVFRLYDAPGGGTLLGTNNRNNVSVQGGVFNVTLDYGAGPFETGEEVWLEIDARTPAGGGGFTTLAPRQPVGAAPRSLSTRGINVLANNSVGIGDFPAPSSFFQVISPAEDKGLAIFNFTGPLTAGFDRDGTDGCSVRFSGLPDPDFWDIGTQAGGNWRIGPGPGLGGDAGLHVQRDSDTGIGTASPTAKLHIRDTDGGTFLRIDDNGTSRFLVENDLTQAVGRFGLNETFNNVTCNIRLLDGDSAILNVSDGAQGFFSVEADGDAFFQGPSTNINGAFRVGNGNHRIGPTTFGNVALTIDVPEAFGLVLNQGDAGKPGGGSWANTSDIRLKKNVTDLRGSLDTLLSLRGVNFEYKDAKAIGELEGVRTGFIAQEVENVIPDWVWDGGDGYKRVTIRGFEALSVEAMRELKQENDDLKARVEMLEAMVEDILLSK